MRYDGRCASTCKTERNAHSTETHLQAYCKEAPVVYALVIEAVVVAMVMVMVMGIVMVMEAVAVAMMGMGMGMVVMVMDVVMTMYR